MLFTPSLFLPSSPAPSFRRDAHSLQPTWELVKWGIIFSPQLAHCLPQGHCGKGTTVASGWHICSLRQARPPGSSHALASVSHASLITTLVSLLSWRQRALTGATCLQIWASTFLIERALSIMFTLFLFFHPSGALFILNRLSTFKKYKFVMEYICRFLIEAPYVQCCCML